MSPSHAGPWRPLSTGPCRPMTSPFPPPRVARRSMASPLPLFLPLPLQADDVLLGRRRGAPGGDAARPPAARGRGRAAAPGAAPPAKARWRRGPPWDYRAGGEGSFRAGPEAPAEGPGSRLGAGIPASPSPHPARGPAEPQAGPIRRRAGGSGVYGPGVSGAAGPPARSALAGSPGRGLGPKASHGSSKRRDLNAGHPPGPPGLGAKWRRLRWGGW